MEQAAIYQLLVEKLGEGAGLQWQAEEVQPIATIAPEKIAEAAVFLRDDPRLDFSLLMCLSGIDWDGYDENGKGKSVAILGYNEDGTAETSDRVAEGDFGVAYHLYSYEHEHKFALQLRVPRGNPVVPTVSHVWTTAMWHEREAFDLLGIRFDGHPDLRRILLEEGWEGHPLRKDYQMPSRWHEVPMEGKPYNKNPYQKDEGPPAPDSDDSGEG
jgi:NADH-quinone oxidoreductase subunit C